MNDLIAKTAAATASQLARHYISGFGICPSSDPRSNFYDQLWSRDMTHAAGNYFVRTDPKAVEDSLRTIFKHQKESGELPFRVERQYLLLRLIPGLRSLAKPLFNFMEENIKGRHERPVYEGQDFSGAEDTVPLVILSLGNFFKTPAGHAFVNERLSQAEKAVSFFRKKVDQSDGLAAVQSHNSDWADSINRGGKLTDINIWWAESLNVMSQIFEQLNMPDKAEKYRQEFERVKTSIREKLYNASGGYFKASEEDDRIDAVASIYGAIYLLDAAEAEHVEQKLKNRLLTVSGLRNFDPPYPQDKILLPFKLISHQGYHNEYVWPWVTCQNIQVKIKIAQDHPEENVREQYKKEAVEDLVSMAALFHDAQGAYEVFRNDSRTPAITKWYKPPRNFLGSLAGFQGAYLRLKHLGWLE